MNKFLIAVSGFLALMVPNFLYAQVPADESNVDDSVITQTSLIWQESSQYWQAFLERLPMVGIGLFLLIAIVFIARPLSLLLVRPIAALSTSLLIQVVSRRLVSILIILFGLYLFLRFAGLSEFAVAILSGTGVLGLIIGFAFKDIAENFISSLLLSVQKPFKIDDVIEVDGRIGVVKQVTARATTLVDFNGDHIQIPNSMVYKNIIRNLTANPRSRGQFVIGIGYDSSIVKAQQVALNTLMNTNAVLQTPEPQVLVDVLASSTVNLKVYFWIDSHQHSLGKVASLLMRTILREFEQSGISMPDDAREVIFPQGINVHQSNTNALAKGKVANDSESNKPSADQQRSDQQRDDQQRKESAINDLDIQGKNSEDLTSDADDIREQARIARDPEAGDNIL
jgi:small-conductance mechanosensitive channel